eukprot:maker-scaffold_147-snap-gene-0.7-mRNA-1 protein AED:0.56 eAED:1.00 QI:31/0/0/0.5/0/0/2/74/39
MFGTITLSLPSSEATKPIRRNREEAADGQVQHVQTGTLT